MSRKSSTQSNEDNPPAKGCRPDCPGKRKRKSVEVECMSPKCPTRVTIAPVPCPSRICPTYQYPLDINEPLIRCPPVNFPPKPILTRQSNQATSVMKPPSGFSPCPAPSCCRTADQNTPPRCFPISNQGFPLCQTAAPCRPRQVPSTCQMFTPCPVCEKVSQSAQTSPLCVQFAAIREQCVQTQPRVIAISSFMPPKGCSTPIEIRLPNDQLSDNRDLKIELFIHQLPEQEDEATPEEQSEESSNQKQKEEAQKLEVKTVKQAEEPKEPNEKQRGDDDTISQNSKIKADDLNTKNQPDDSKTSEKLKSVEINETQSSGLKDDPKKSEDTSSDSSESEDDSEDVPPLDQEDHQISETKVEDASFKARTPRKIDSKDAATNTKNDKKQKSDSERVLISRGTQSSLELLKNV